jgi:hypothetical protein
MASPRPSQRDLADAKKAARREEMDLAIAEGRLTVRQMTPQEREQSDARLAAADKARSASRQRRDAGARPRR